MVDSHPLYSPEERELKAVALDVPNSDIEVEEDSLVQSRVILQMVRMRSYITGKDMEDRSDVSPSTSSLQLQCRLLYIIGHITFEPHYKKKEWKQVNKKH